MSWRCSVPGCGKRNQAKAKGVVIHRFPEKDVELCSKWLAAIGRDVNKTEKKYSSLRVCSQHFTPDDYERDLKAELLGCSPKKILKKTAIPSIFKTKRKPGKRPSQPPNKRLPEIVVQIGSSDNECYEQSHQQVLTEEHGLYLSSDEEEEEMKKKRKRSKSEDSSDEQHLHLDEEATDSDVSMDEDLFIALKEDGQGKLVVWCTHCGTQASLSCSVLRHKKVFCCAQCSAGDHIETHRFEALPVRFEDIGCFQKHAEQEHGTKPFYILCQDCGKFVIANKEHVCEHKVKFIICPECGKRFLTEGGLKTHYTQLHSDYDHPCKYCLKVFKTRSRKVEHEQTHPKEHQPYSCPDCPERFDNIHKRNTHVKSHRGPHKYVCDVCEKGFRDINRLRRHKLIHSGEKPFKCQVCERSFNRMENLGAHMRVHTGERPFVCEQCGESFSHNVSLKNHKQRHHDSGLSQEKVLHDVENKVMNMNAAVAVP